MSESTKNTIALAFKKVMETKPFDKITIQDITSECKINRQSFYYHFEDRLDLIKWIFYTEVFFPVVEILTVDNIYNSFLLMFKIMNDEYHFYKNAFSMNCDRCFKNYLYSVLQTLIVTISNKSINSIDVCFYASGLLGVISSWLKQGSNYSIEELADNATRILSTINKSN